MSDEILLTDDNIAPMQEELFRLYSQGFLTDITLSCEDGKNFEAHRVLLAARSAYFYAIVPKLKIEPVIFLKGVKGSHLEKILKFVYSGSAKVSKSQLRPILEVAKSLQIRGLQDLATTELSRGTNTTVSCSTKYGGGSKTSSPVPPRKEPEQTFRSSPSSQSAREIAVQQQQKLYDKLTSAKKSPSKPTNSHSPSYKSSASKRGRPSMKNASTKTLKSEENGEETFKFQYQYISDDSEEIDKDDSNDSDFELAAKRNQSQLQAKGSPLKKKRGRPPKSHASSEVEDRGRPPKSHPSSELVASRNELRKKYEKEESDDEDVFDNIGTGPASKSSSDDETDNTSDELDNDHDLDNDSSDSDSENESDDQSDDDESQHSFPKASSPKMNMKTASPITKKAAESKVKREEGAGASEEFYDSPPPPVRRSGGRGPMINGKHILPVQCKGKRAELHLSKFGNGSNGKSIKYKGEWMTPEDYEQACGSKTRKYLESITTDYGPLKTLTASGLLKPHPKKCKCSACSDEVLTSSPEKAKKDEKRDAHKKEGPKVEGATFKKQHPEVEKPKQRKREPSVDMDDPEGDRDHSKRRKKETEKPEVRSKPSLPSTAPSTLTTSHSTQAHPAHSKALELTPSSRHSSPKPHFSKHHSSRTEASSGGSSKSTPTTTTSPSKLSSPSLHKSEIIAPPTLTTTKPVLTSPATATASVPSHSSFSPSTTKPLASPSFIALSPATSINPLPSIQSSLTSSVVAFPSKLSGIPSSSSSLSTLPSYSQPSTTLAQATTTTPATTTTTTTSFGQVKVESKMSVSKQQIPIQMGPPKPGEVESRHQAPVMATQQLQVQTLGQTLSHTKTGRNSSSIMQVRCKSVPALLYVSKYESGSKGKCILVEPPHTAANEWMTPNEYEEKSGSKAKKYLSSIKCLGRPLRAYVNSGELRGTGPPPSPKPPKMNKPKPPQLIAPAPSPSQGALGMGGGLGMAPPGMSPAHIPGALPQSLAQVAMMGGGQSIGQPIILNQSNLANSMHNQMLTPMTLTFAPMSAGMQQQQQQQQQQAQQQPSQHHLQQHQMHQQQQQQLHSSGEYILQHK